MSDFASTDTGVKDLEFVVPGVAVGSAQVADPQTIQKAKGSLVPTSGDTAMGEASAVAASTPNSRLATFLTRFDLLEFNSLLPAIFIVLSFPMAASCASPCLQRVYHCWKD